MMYIGSSLCMWLKFSCCGTVSIFGRISILVWMVCELSKLGGARSIINEHRTLFISEKERTSRNVTVYFNKVYCNIPPAYYSNMQSVLMRLPLLGFLAVSTVSTIFLSVLIPLSLWVAETRCGLSLSLVKWADYLTYFFSILF